ncbi:Outer membrane protein transport protein (OMPP1/FadL/TodX) [Thalassoglobus neptunius]|uniref:Outer membrane protein transport protein (OMPP1/FadL/TodX) n=1 Tax=Thalassoglobus neptunius TaxID=1938619 RepID=A0A5C5X306_9PLAN|nr:hypothetical protein [Thalassoglobus neptunius]TWT56651.1 Outer membrane protein transport protein (OMPP1/FadL/TodX) [Thalassoglobus neptunius]
MRIHNLIQSFCIGALLLVARTGFAQSYGIELHNTLMPASSGMGGTSLSRPQDSISATNGNPATLTQYHGTNVTFGGAFGDANFRIRQHDAFPNPPLDPIVTPYSAKSDYPATVLPNIGLTQQLEIMGMPMITGIAFVGDAGAGVDFTDSPESGGAAAGLTFLTVVASGATEVTDNLSVGGSFRFTTGTLDSPFAGVSRNSLDYGVRGTFGANYNLGYNTTVGVTYQTKQEFNFNNAVLLNLGNGNFGGPQDVSLDLPRNVGFGVANSSLMNGNLLLAVDVIWKNWDDADLFSPIYDDQWVVQVGSQLTHGRLKYRLGYAYAQNPIQSPPTVGSIGGVTPPGLLAGVEYVQAQLAVINEHRLSGGLGIQDFLPGIDVDCSIGKMFGASQDLGSTTVDLSSYWLTFGVTWHFDGPGRSNSCL